MLAVGDAAFQAKCLDRINELHRQGRTIVFISHDLAAVERLCGRVLLLTIRTGRRRRPVHATSSRSTRTWAAARRAAEERPPDLVLIA